MKINKWIKIMTTMLLFFFLSFSTVEAEGVQAEGTYGTLK